MTLLSPGIEIKEKDLSAYISRAATGRAATVGKFQWGPCFEIKQVTDESDVVNTFGLPDAYTAPSFFSVTNFLKYANDCRVVRICNDAVALNSSAEYEYSINIVSSGSGDLGEEYVTAEEVIANYGTPATDHVIGTITATAGLITAITLDPVAVKNMIVSGVVNPTLSVDTVNGVGAVLTSVMARASSMFFANDTYADEAMADAVHVAAVTALGIPSVYGRFPGAYGDDIEVTLISYADFINPAVTTIPKVPTGGTTPKVTSIYGVNGPRTSDQWAITVSYKGEVVETFVGSTKAGDKDIYGRTIYIPDLFLSGVSKYIMMSLDAPLTTSMHLVLASGNDSGALAGDWIQGWDLLADPDTLYVNLLFAGGACNESEEDSLTIQQYISQSVAEVRRDCIAFLSPAISTTTRIAAADAVANAVQYRTDLAINSSFAEGDSGQHKWQFDKYNDRKWWIANNADIAGLCAFTDRVAAPWNSPAGLNRGVIKGVIKLAYDAKKSLRDTLYEAQLNPIVHFPAEGYCLFGDKTLQGNPSAFDRINVRRLFNLLEKAIGDASKYKLFENNTAFTRRSFVTQVSAYLDTIKAQGGIIEYYVWCDERNNTPAVIDRNEFVGTIYVKSPRSINYITLNFVATATGANFEELIASQI